VPEGDTLHRAAARLRPALAGAELLAFEAPRLVGDRPRPGERIESVEAVGKHLLIAFSGGLTLQTHLRMTGSWHLHRTGERWRKPRHLMRCRIAVPGWEAVCFSAPVVRTWPTSLRGSAADPIGHLGPDLTVVPGEQPGVADPDAVDEAVARMRRLVDPDVTIGEALLDQRVGSGIGNVYRSEVCWVCGVSPFAPVGRVDDALASRLLATASRLLQRNLGEGRRTTVPGGLAVYGRRGRPCRRCGTAVRSTRVGEQARIVYWCPTCQPGPVPPGR
jgi:endonuclease-8